MSEATRVSEGRTFDAAAEEAALVARCREATARAMAAGADEAETFGHRSQSTTVRFEKGDMKLTQVDEGSTLGVRLFRDHRLGFSSTNQLGPAALDAAARDAHSLAALNPPDDANRLPDPCPPAPRLDLVYADMAAMPVERVIEVGRDFVQRIRAVDPRLSVDSASVTAGTTARAVCNSLGTRSSEADAALTFFVFGMAVDGDDVAGFHYCGDVVRDPARLEASIAAAVDQFATVALGNLGAGLSESYRGPVLFAPDAFLEIFIAPFLSAASAVAVQRGRSALAGRVGETVASPLLSIHDDPTDPLLGGASSFDREGQPLARFPVMEAGVLRSLLYNGYAARVDGVASTGHATGGPRDVPLLGVHAVDVAAGRGGDRAAMTAALDRGLFVQRFAGTVDPASGDFSGVAKSARWVEDGFELRSVRETLLSGNAFELLRNIVTLSTETARCMGEARAPYALVDGVSVTTG